MTKDIQEIEKLLRDEKLPDQDTSHVKRHVWQSILRCRRERQDKGSPIFRIKPWLWPLASIVLILLCFLLIWLMFGSSGMK